MAPYITVRHTESRTLYFITDIVDISTYLEDGALRGHWTYECYPSLETTAGQEHFYGEELTYICKAHTETLARIVAITDDHPPTLDDRPTIGEAVASASQIMKEQAQKFAVGAREMKEGEEGIKINLGFNPSGEETVSVNFDDHYKQAKTDKVGEPIDIIEALEVRLIKAGVDVNEACNICRGLKYVLRGSFKEGEDVQKELRKFYNYTHRARTGKWLGGR